MNICTLFTITVAGRNILYQIVRNINVMINGIKEVVQNKCNC